MQELNKNIENSDLIVALKNATEELKEHFLSNMSSRVSAVIKEEMEYLRGVRAKDVEAAQQRIVAKVRELEERGDITLSGGRDDEYV
jgi:flagellar motor switch protein FliG